MNGDTFTRGAGPVICGICLIDVIDKHVAHHEMFDTVSLRPARLIGS
jgi:hypothetical protein